MRITHTCEQPNSDQHTHNRVHACLRAGACSHTHTKLCRMVIIQHTRTCARAHTHTHTHTHRNTHAQDTHARTHSHPRHTHSGALLPHRRPRVVVIVCVRLRRRDTPLHGASNGHYEVVRLLVANRADVTARNNEGFVESSRCRCAFRFVLPSGRCRRRVGPVNHCGSILG